MMCVLAVALPACNPPAPPAHTGTAALALQTGDEIRFYLGQPGIEHDVPAIESGQLIAGGWVRISTPAGAALAGQATRFDLTAASGATFWQSFPSAPGCTQDPGPYLGKWKSGDPGVSGEIEIGKNADGSYNVFFDFAYEGVWDLPCGELRGAHSFSNRYLSIPMEKQT
jgi:hypothetical protein